MKYFLMIHLLVLMSEKVLCNQMSESQNVLVPESLANKEETAQYGINDDPEETTIFNDDTTVSTLDPTTNEVESTEGLDTTSLDTTTTGEITTTEAATGSIQSILFFSEFSLKISYKLFHQNFNSKHFKRKFYNR